MRGDTPCLSAPVCAAGYTRRMAERALMPDETTPCRRPALLPPPDHRTHHNHRPRWFAAHYRAPTVPPRPKTRRKTERRPPARRRCRARWHVPGSARYLNTSESGRGTRFLPHEFRAEHEWVPGLSGSTRRYALRECGTSLFLHSPWATEPDSAHVKGECCFLRELPTLATLGRRPACSAQRNDSVSLR